MSRARDRADGVLHNRTHEDTEGGRESLITFKGEQSGGEISTLAQIQASHDGTGDDQKSDLIFKTNGGSDGTSPSEAARIDSQSNFLIGHSDNTNVAGHEAGLQVVGQGTADYHGSTISIIGNANNANGAYLNFAKTRSNTAGTATAASAGDTVGQINFSAADGTDLANRIGYIQAKVNDNVASNDTAGRFEFATTAQGSGVPALRARIDVDGIKFGSDTAAANGLNDYEEGTWTPVFAGSSGVSGQTYSQQLGAYTKVGRFVYLTAYVVLSNVGSVTGSYAYINGLPFAPNTDSNAYFGVGHASYVTNLGVNASSVMLYANPGATFSYVTYFAGATTGITYMPPAGFTNSTGMIFNLGYATDA